MSDWTRPGDLKSRLQREWDRGRILAAEAAGESLFPCGFPSGIPAPGSFWPHFGEAREWIEDITGRSREKTGRGYDLEWQEVNHRQLAGTGSPWPPCSHRRRTLSDLSADRKTPSGSEPYAATSWRRFPGSDRG